MRRVAAILTVLALAVLAAGCGSSGSGGSGLAEALSYMPKDSPVVLALQTDPNGSQWKAVNGIVSKFPFSSQLKQGFKQGLSQQGFNYDSDLKPLLGNELVYAVPTVAALHVQGSTPQLVAVKAKDEGKAKDFLARSGTKVGTVSGVDVYRNQRNTSFNAVQDGVLLSAPTQQQLQQAIQRHGGGDSAHLTESDYNRLTSGVKKDGLLTVGLDLRQIIAGAPNSAKALRVKWVAALRTLGLSLSAQSSSLAVDMSAKTEGVTASDLPLAPGPQSPALVRVPAEVGLGVRGLGQTFAFFKSVAAVTSPTGYAKFLANVQKANKQLGLDLQKDVVGQLNGDVVASVAIDGAWAVRATPRDATALKATVAKFSSRITKLSGSSVKSVARGPAGLYVVTGKTGTKTYLGVIGDSFVVAKSAARAQQIAQQPTSTVPGAKGAFVLALDARSVANAVADQRGVAQAKLFTGTLGDLVGSVEAEPSGLTGSFTLNFK